jgi:hypothetical protein
MRSILGKGLSEPPSATRLLTVRAISVAAAALAAALVPTACSLLPPDDPARVADESVEKGSKGKAQDRLDYAASTLKIKRTATFSVRIPSVPYSTTGSFDLRRKATDYTLKVKADGVTTRVRTRLVDGESYVQFATNDPQGSAFKQCWVRYLGDADAAPLPYAASLALDPVAKGVAKDEKNAVVAQVRTLDALGAALPKLVTKLPDGFDTASRIPALVTLRSKTIASVRYDLVDLKKALEKQKIDLEKLSAESKDSGRDFIDHAGVTVRYSAVGARTDIPKPPRRTVMTVDAAEPDATPKLCVDAR